ncbi:recombination regulator RecX [Anoxybacillus flavithermus]|uniref:Regulatory protein RecX n=1 Tax=Anoxybacillus flavithermus TaxID=33934 RepID=A0A2G5RN00_9BACL|nr:recombination regulator RecX [Anoxybacillus flavithermus]PIC04184.1 recombination regulator RecX [Anoxybacillus flavithermus]
MWIEKIEVDRKNAERFYVHFVKEDGDKHTISVDQDILIEYRMKKGMTVTREQWAEMIKKDDEKQAYKMALRFLAYRMRSKQEVVDYLKKRHIDAQTIERVIGKLQHEQYIDDEQFAHAYVQTQMNTTLKGPYVIYKELMDKGVSEDVITKAMERYTEDMQRDKAIKWMEKINKQSKKRSYQEQKTYIAQLLHMKGFPSHIVEMAKQHVTADDGKEWEALIYYGEKAHRRYETYDRYTYEQKMKQALYRKGFSLSLIEKFLEKKKEE